MILAILTNRTRLMLTQKKAATKQPIRPSSMSAVPDDKKSTPKRELRSAKLDALRITRSRDNKKKK